VANKIRISSDPSLGEVGDESLVQEAAGSKGNWFRLMEWRLSLEGVAGDGREGHGGPRQGKWRE